jgi:hypothetical protein
MTKEQKLKKKIGAQTKCYENVFYQLKSADGKFKPLWKMNALGNFFLKLLRKLVPNPITEDGQIKQGKANHFSAYGFRIPILFGFWTTKLFMPNAVTNAGFAGLASRINGSGAEAAFTYIGLGTGTTAFAVGNTTLETELTDSGLARANSTASRVTTTVTNDTAQLVNTFSVTGTKAVTESGVLNAASAGTLLCRQVFSAINVVNTDSLQITWKVKAA